MCISMKEEDWKYLSRMMWSKKHMLDFFVLFSSHKSYQWSHVVIAYWANVIARRNLELGSPLKLLNLVLFFILSFENNLVLLICTTLWIMWQFRTFWVIYVRCLDKKLVLKFKIGFLSGILGIKEGYLYWKIFRLS